MDRMSLKAAAISIMNQAEFLTGFMLTFALWALIAFCKMAICHIAIDPTELATGERCSIWPAGMVSFRWGHRGASLPNIHLGTSSTESSLKPVRCRAYFVGVEGTIFVWACCREYVKFVMAHVRSFARPNVVFRLNNRPAETTNFTSFS